MTSMSTELASSKAAAAEGKARLRSRRLPGYVVAYIILGLGVIVSLFPYFLALMTSLKPSNQMFSGSAWSLPNPVTFQNYVAVVTQYNFLAYIWHSLIFAVIVTL